MAVLIHLEPELSIVKDRVQLPDLPTAKAKELVAFLVENRGQRFDRRLLEERFWPSSDRQHAQLSLRQAVFAIRHLLGEDGPISANRRQVYCRSSQVHVSSRKDGSSSESIDKVRENSFESKLLATFRRTAPDRVVLMIQSELDKQNLSRESLFRLKFILAYSYQELGRFELALELASMLVNDAQSGSELMLAKHARGGILWHAGRFKEGIGELWESAALAEKMPNEGIHVLSNIAIGAYEARSSEELQYAEAMASQKMRNAGPNEHSVVLDYVHGLALASERQFMAASKLFEATLLKSSSDSHRISVYLLEANAEMKRQLGLRAEAASLLAQAKGLRKVFNMHPSHVELKRLQKLHAELR